MNQRNGRGIAKKAGAATLLTVGALSLTGCDVTPPAAIDKVLRMGWPEGITPEAHSLGNFWVWIWVAAWTIGIIMWGLFLVAIFRWSAKRAKREGRGEFPKQLQYNIPLELVLTTIPIVIVMAIFFFTTQAQNKVTALDKNPEVTVDVTGFQWNWKFGYAEIDQKLSPTGSKYMGEDPARQQQAADSAMQPDVNGNLPIHGKSKKDLSYLHFNKIETLGTTEEIPVLVLPSHTPIEFRLASADVSHSFWIPEFLFKRDVYSHPETNQQQRAFQVEEIEREGAFVGRCAELCGTYHAMMNFELRVVTADQFREYLKFRNENPQAPNSEALRHIGEEPYAITTHPFNTDRATPDGNNYVDNNKAA
ncbi:cytochrome c oxidase subunit II [Corynebacterium caspium]|uniref:aa3-type cytochrome oxidase subunit II n=1 Tax=Corynebacterium caspium TaxID=234828 RepID=UPI000373A675|nr:cytochrome c oxidase subunit II [Corynebacterium caspium]WKD58966.1 Cytochrome c oxidase subunit 2 precursor [Corynebacterium caspium DSM 44850]